MAGVASGRHVPASTMTTSGSWSFPDLRALRTADLCSCPRALMNIDVRKRELQAKPVPPQVMRKSRIREGLPLSPRRHLGRAWRQLRPVLGQRHQGRALPVRRRAASARSSASRCPSTPTRSGTATCRMRGRARSTAIACTAPTSRRPATASIPTSCCSIPTPSSWSATSSGTRRCSATRWRPATTSPSTSATARRS